MCILRLVLEERILPQTVHWQGLGPRLCLWRMCTSMWFLVVKNLWQCSHWYGRPLLCSDCWCSRSSPLQWQEISGLHMLKILWYAHCMLQYHENIILFNQSIYCKSSHSVWINTIWFSKSTKGWCHLSCQSWITGNMASILDSQLTDQFWLIETI